MKIRKEYVILAVLIVVLSAYLVLHQRDRTHYRLPVLAQVSGERIGKIVIKTPKKEVTLKKKGSYWQILPQGYRVDKQKIGQILDAVGKLKLTALVSEAGQYRHYDLDDGHKITVRAWSDKNKLLRQFDVGKVASSFIHTFVRLKGDGRVYHAQGNLRERFDQPVADLRDKTVLAFDKQRIIEIALVRDGKTTVFKRQAPVKAKAKAGEKAPPAGSHGTVWLGPQGNRADTAGIDRLLTALDKLQCDGYIEKRAKADFKNPAFEVRLKTVDSEYRLDLFAPPKKGNGQYAGVSSGSAYPFRLSKWQAEKIMRKPADLTLKKTPKKNPPQKTRK